MERFTAQQRSKLMSRVRGKNTKPELIVRGIAHQLGYRFRLHRRDLPGTPDLVFPRHKKVILVHGCFWHMHTCRKGKIAPITNADFWRAKRQGNAKCDRRDLKSLQKLGWSVFTVWECETRNVEKLVKYVEHFLSA